MAASAAPADESSEAGGAGMARRRHGAAASKRVGPVSRPCTVMSDGVASDAIFSDRI